jgi:glutathione synthase/RimK-type ligase-like ATP-grasp enzyme
VITAVGLDTDPTIRYFCATAAQLGAAVQLIDLAQVVTGSWQLSLPPHHPSWVSWDTSSRHCLDPDGAYYCRLIDLGGVCPTQTLVWKTVVTAFSSWLELCPGTVVNRPGHANDNACKPLHEARLASMGFAVPPSFTGSRRSELIAFTAEGATVAKALSGQRADCRVVTVDDFVDYDDRSGPVHLQRFVPGDDVRAHVVGDEIIAVRIMAAGPDYRLDTAAHFERCTLPDRVADLLRQATRSFGLAFAGWDLRVRGDECWVLEANPMPGYSYYDSQLEGRITGALIDHLQVTR